MYKNAISILICLNMVLPALLSAAALDRYTVPQHPPQSGTNVSRPGGVSEEVYHKFERDVSNYNSTQKNELSNDFNERKANALRGENFDAALHYQRLIDILNSN